MLDMELLLAGSFYAGTGTRLMISSTIPEVVNPENRA
jgi:hypothetical protein